jgi:hypothetical protein
MLMRIVDQAFAAFEKGAEEGVRKVTSQTTERADDCGKLGLTECIHAGQPNAGLDRLSSPDFAFVEKWNLVCRKVESSFRRLVGQFGRTNHQKPGRLCLCRHEIRLERLGNMKKDTDLSQLPSAYFCVMG